MLKKVAYKKIEDLCRSSVCDRAIATQLEISPGTVINRIERLARQFIAFHTGNLANLKLTENLKMHPGTMPALK